MRLLSTLIATLLLTNVAVAEEAIPPDKDQIKFESKVGIVTFKHKKHAEMTITMCSTCHHTHTGKIPIKGCDECHEKKSKEETPAKKKAFHTRCQSCHQYTMEQGLKAGPLKKQCKLCHIKNKKP